MFLDQPVPRSSAQHRQPGVGKPMALEKPEGDPDTALNSHNAYIIEHSEPFIAVKTRLECYLLHRAKRPRGNDDT